MIGFAERINDHEVLAFVALDTIEALAGRVRDIVESGRPMTVVRRLLGETDDSLPSEIHAGLSPMSDAAGGSVRIVRDKCDGVVSSVAVIVLCPESLGWGFAAHWRDDKTEAEVLARFNRSRDSRRFRNITRIEIIGTAQSRDTRIVITAWNNDRVGQRTEIAFAPLPSKSEVAESEAAIIEALADARASWTSDDLKALASDMRYRWLPAKEALVAPAK